MPPDRHVPANTRRRSRAGWLLFALAMAGLAIGAALLPPIAQPSEYHQFADQRACLGLPNCLDTGSNLLFVLAGVFGLVVLQRLVAGRRLQDRREAIPLVCFFGGVVLIGLGSGWYHLAPDNAGLAWDRLAMMFAFMSWFAAIVGERAGARIGLALLPLLLAAGLGSVLWWAASEARGAGDLRAYLLMQLCPMLAVPALLVLLRPRYSGDRQILAVIGLYALALLLDLGDRPVFEFTGGRVSGHTLKHALGAAAVLLFAAHLQRRRIL